MNCYNLCNSKIVNQIKNFLFCIPDCDSVHDVASVFIGFPFGSEGDVPFHRTCFAYSYADWDGFGDHIRYVPWEDIFNLGPFKFCE